MVCCRRTSTILPQLLTARQCQHRHQNLLSKMQWSPLWPLPQCVTCRTRNISRKTICKHILTYRKKYIVDGSIQQACLVWKVIDRDLCSVLLSSTFSDRKIAYSLLPFYFHPHKLWNRILLVNWLSVFFLKRLSHREVFDQSLLTPCNFSPPRLKATTIQGLDCASIACIPSSAIGSGTLKFPRCPFSNRDPTASKLSQSQCSTAAFPLTVVSSPLNIVVHDRQARASRRATGTYMTSSSTYTYSDLKDIKIAQATRATTSSK